MGKKITQPQCASCITGTHSIFGNLDEPQVQFLSDQKYCQHYQKGQVIFQEGARPQGLYCVNAGKIKLTYLGDDGREQIIHLAKAGDILGYRALLGDDTYSLSAIAMEECAICFIPRTSFLELVQQNGKLAGELIKLLTAELRMTEEHLAGMAQKTVRERLAEALLLLRETYGFEPGTHILQVQLSREELANMVGTATETIIRLLTEMKHENIVELNGKKIHLVDMAAIEKLARR